MKKGEKNMVFDDLHELDIDLNNVIDQNDFKQLDLDKDGIPDSVDADLAGIKGVPDRYESNLVGTFLPDRFEADLNRNMLADKFEQKLFGRPLKRLAYDVNGDGRVDAIDAVVLRKLMESRLYEGCMKDDETSLFHVGDIFFGLRAHAICDLSGSRRVF